MISKAGNLDPQHEWMPWAVMMLGVLAFWVWGGAYTLSPKHIGWVMSGLDTSTHYLGWQFFRDSPLLQWPLGANPAYGTDAPGTIVLSDSIPLLAILLKLISPILPAQFQYLGLWAFSCFLLQAWFGYRLLGRLSDDVIVQLIGTVFFLSAPIFLLRLYMHPALATQWLLLAGLNLVLDRSFRARMWLLLLWIAVLVQAYLFVMLAVIWLADIVQRLLRRESTFSQLVLHIVMAIVGVLLLMWSAGYFVNGVALTMPRRFYLDLLFPLWTGVRYFGEWSWFMPASDLDTSAYDGFGYFGAGFIALVLVATVIALMPARYAWGGVVKSIHSSTWIALSVVSAVLLIFALGSKIYFARQLLFSYPVPGWLDHIYDIFRSHARMMWPVWYMTLLATFYLLLRRVPPTYVRWIIVLALLVQLGDLSKAAVNIRASLAKDRGWHSALNSPLWPRLAAQYKHVAYLQPEGYPAGMVMFMPDYRGVANFAVSNGMMISIAYLAREDESLISKVRAIRVDSLLHGESEPNTFYIIKDDSVWSRLICMPSAGQWLGVIDDIRILVPKTLISLSAEPRAVCHE